MRCNSTSPWRGRQVSPDHEPLALERDFRWGDFEGFQALCERMSSLFDAAASSGETTLIVSHGGPTMSRGALAVTTVDQKSVPE